MSLGKRDGGDVDVDDHIGLAEGFELEGGIGRDVDHVAALGVE